MSAAPDLPSFLRPPVREVALGIRFDPLPLELPHVVTLWERLRADLPGFEQQPPLPPTPPEDLSTDLQPQIQLAMVAAPPLPRFWLVSDDRTEVCQVQSDRLVVNWRQERAEDVYPRYEHVRDLLRSCAATFTDVLKEAGIEGIHVFQAEVDYVNQIDRGEGWDDLSDLGNVFTFFNPVDIDETRPAPSTGGAAFQFLVPNTADPVGRLYLDVVTSTRDDLRVLNLVLRSRVPLNDGELDDAFGALDFGRSSIVRTFAAVTTPAMHERWEREH